MFKMNTEILESEIPYNILLGIKTKMKNKQYCKLGHKLTRYPYKDAKTKRYCRICYLERKRKLYKENHEIPKFQFFGLKQKT